MKRKYFYAQMVGRTGDALENIRRIVVRADLASQISLVKLERNAGRQFYVFLGVDSGQDDGIPGGLGQAFKSIGINFIESTPLQLEEIKSMVQRQDIEIHGFNTLPYRQRRLEEHGDPFDQSDVWQSQEASPEECARYEQLLHWVSARGEGTWESFAGACEVLGVAEDRQGARSAFRQMSLLGHLENSGNGLRWSVAPASLVRFPDGPDSGFLAGQRTASVLRQVGELWPLSEMLHPHHPGPPRIELFPQMAFHFIGVNIADAGATSARLADLLPCLNQWKALQPSIQSLNTAVYRLERWQDGDLHTCDTFFERDGLYFGESGMYRLTWDGDPSGRSMTLFFDQPTQRWLQGDWYGLRFLAIEAGQDGCRAIHDATHSELLIPASQRWPLLYERALTLASGLLPDRVGNPSWLRYTHVTVRIAQELCHKLNVDLEER